MKFTAFQKIQNISEMNSVLYLLENIAEEEKEILLTLQKDPVFRASIQRSRRSENSMLFLASDLSGFLKHLFKHFPEYALFACISKFKSF